MLNTKNKDAKRGIQKKSWGFLGLLDKFCQDNLQNKTGGGNAAVSKSTSLFL